MIDIEAQKDRLGRWFRNTVAKLEPDRLVLLHLQSSERLVEVTSCPIDGETDQKELLAQIVSALETDAEGLGGVQRYMVVARREQKRLGRLPLRVIGGEGDENDEPIDSEPPNAEGLLAQLMRHLEVKERMNARSWGQVLMTMQRTIARQQDALESSESDRLNVTKIAEQVLSRNHERAVLSQMAQDNSASKNMVMQSFMALMPLVQHWLTKGGTKGATPASPPQASMPVGAEDTTAPREAEEPAPAPRAHAEGEGASELESLLGSFLGSLDAQQRMALFGMLTPEQIALVGRMTQAVSSPS